LFGHEKGAFTSAVARRRGRFELADGGTLFLDEISEIDPAIQVKLLRVLEEQRFERVGGDQTLDVDIRLIAATNRNLKELVDSGKFREDLFFRLDVVNIVLPPLRERLDDIPLLCSHFVREFSRKNKKEIEGITPDAVEVLSLYPWPGNVRELGNTVEKMAVLARSARLTVRDIPQNIKDVVRQKDGVSTGLDQRSVGGAGNHAKDRPEEGPDSLADMEKAIILATLKKHGQNRTKAAVELGISRRTLHRKLKRYGGEEHGEEPVD
jgi:two-component system response regulator HydG